MPEFDITNTNIAVEQLLEATVDPRHRYMLESTTAIVTWRWLTAARAGELLEHLIKPLPSFDEGLLLAA